MHINQAGLDLIKHFEGLRLKAYRDAVGVWTIGYGHTSMAGVPLVHRGMVITEAEAETILKRDLQKYEQAVMDNLKSGINDNQFSALVSFCYNVGVRNFRRSSALSYVKNHVESVKDDLASYKVEVAKSFATNDTVNKLNDKLVNSMEMFYNNVHKSIDQFYDNANKSIDQVHASLDQQNTRLDRLHARLDKLFEKKTG